MKGTLPPIFPSWPRQIPDISASAWLPSMGAWFARATGTMSSRFNRSASHLRFKWPWKNSGERTPWRGCGAERRRVQFDLTRPQDGTPLQPDDQRGRDRNFFADQEETGGIWSSGVRSKDAEG